MHCRFCYGGQHSEIQTKESSYAGPAWRSGIILEQQVRDVLVKSGQLSHKSNCRTKERKKNP